MLHPSADLKHSEFQQNTERKIQVGLVTGQLFRLNDKVQKMLISCTWVVLVRNNTNAVCTIDRKKTITYGPTSQNIKQKQEDKQNCSYLTEHIQQQSAFHSQENISSSCLEPCVAAMKPKRRVPICFPRGHGGRSQLIPKQQWISATCFLLDHNLYKDSVLRLNILIRTKTLTLPALRSEQLGGDGCTEFVSWPATSILISIQYSKLSYGTQKTITEVVKVLNCKGNF